MSLSDSLRKRAGCVRVWCVRVKSDGVTRLAGGVSRRPLERKNGLNIKLPAIPMVFQDLYQLGSGLFRDLLSHLRLVVKAPVEKKSNDWEKDSRPLPLRGRKCKHSAKK